MRIAENEKIVIESLRHYVIRDLHLECDRIKS